MKSKFLSRQVLGSNTAILVYLAIVKLVIHLLTAVNHYGYFGDELYFLAMTKHLDFGYVDVPPLVPLLAAVSRWLIGDSLFAVHILPAIIGAIMVYFAGLLARELGGGRFAQWFTALMVIVAPVWLQFNSWFAYDPFDQLFMVIFFYTVALIIQQETPKRWIILGIIIGLGIMIKLSMIFTGVALVVALLFTSRRRSLGTRWPWQAVLIVVAIGIPYIVWNWVHHWPLITYWQNYAQYRNSVAPLYFLRNLVLYFNPLTIPIWVGGLYYLLCHQEGKKFRVLALIPLVLLVYTMSMGFEARMLTASFFPLLAGGAVFLERITSMNAAHRNRWNWIKPVYTGMILLGGLILAPYYLPVLPEQDFLKYSKATGNIVATIKEGHYKPEPDLPFIFAFRLGWPEMVKQIADVYHGLPEDDRRKCVIYASSYPEAAAVDLYGKAYGLPGAISNHLSYQIWGPGKDRGEVAIAFGKRFTQLGAGYGQVTLSAVYNEVSHVGIIPGGKSIISEQNLPIFVCRKPSSSLKEAWRWFQFYY